MNSFTRVSMFTETAEFILNNSELLIKSDCRIHNNVLYEYLSENTDAKYRFFFNCDDYDYLEDAKMIAELDKLFFNNF